MTRFVGLFDTTLDYTLQFTVTHTLVSTVMSSLPLLDSGIQWWCYPSSVLLNGSQLQLPASNSNSSQLLNYSGYLTN
jgi:hypothetical protein